MNDLREYVDLVVAAIPFFVACVAAAFGYGKLNQRVEQALERMRSLEEETKRNTEAMNRLIGKLESLDG